MKNSWILNDLTLEIQQGDITSQNVDAIVNAANSMLDHGGGLAGMIARRGGPVIDSESREWIAKYGSVSHSNPAFTHAGNLPCKFVIHAVGPIWGDGEELKKLGICIGACLTLGEKLGLESIAFPAISTGIYHVPLDIAAQGMLGEIQDYSRAQRQGKIPDIRIILYDLPALEVYLKQAGRIFGEV